MVLIMYDTHPEQVLTHIRSSFNLSLLSLSSQITGFEEEGGSLLDRHRDLADLTGPPQLSCGSHYPLPLPHFYF